MYERRYYRVMLGVSSSHLHIEGDGDALKLVGNRTL